MTTATKSLSQEMESITPPGALVERLDSSALFANVAHPNNSPIDQYFENIGRLRPLYRDEPMRSAYRPEMGTLILLGYMSAVESFLRAMIRGLVVIDEHAQKTAEPLQIQYAAALHHTTKELLPEALLENISLAGTFNVCKTLHDVCGISGITGEPPSVLNALFVEYNKLCQLRHCCVHRFGRLGAQNAQKLGMNDHGRWLEKPIDISLVSLDDITAILQRFVASINSYVFADVLQRSVLRSPLIPLNARNSPYQYKSQWSLDFPTDEPRFRKYYNLFACTNRELPSPPIADIYDKFSQWATGLRNDALQNQRQRGQSQNP